MTFLHINNLTISLSNKVNLLKSISVRIDKGEAHGLVGESGAGKSMIGKAVLGTLPTAAKINSGEIILDGRDLQQLTAKERRKKVGSHIALIPQDPLTALNPVRRVGVQITDRLIDILGWSKIKAVSRARELLREVHISDPKRVMQSFPHELSGGMRQRVLIASAFAAEPKLIIADEPTTALDVIVQKQTLSLIEEMKTKHNTALLFITHDLGLVSKICDKMTVLYGGKILEQTGVRNFFKGPKHLYSQALLTATPKYNNPKHSLIPVPEDVIEAVENEIREYENLKEK